jgi:hypothetical protein
MNIPRSHSSPSRRTTRTLYPDLSSAYIQIQGRRAASYQPFSLTKRFPLSPSTSSSETGSSKKLSIEKDALPLRNISCRKVSSAHGILHAGDQYQESIAVLESSDNLPGTWTRTCSSALLDDILTQYAYTSPSEMAAAEDWPLRNDPPSIPEPTLQRDVRTGSSSYCVSATEQLRHLISEHRSQASTPQRSSHGCPAEPSSQKREVNAATDSTVMSKAKPTSAWDPLSKTTITKPRYMIPTVLSDDSVLIPRIRAKPGDSAVHLTSSSSPPPLISTFLSDKSELDASANYPKLPSVSFTASKSQDTTQIYHNAIQSPSYVLPSSSLFPRILDMAILSPSSPPMPTQSHANDTDLTDIPTMGSGWLHDVVQTGLTPPRPARPSRMTGQPQQAGHSEMQQSGRASASGPKPSLYKDHHAASYRIFQRSETRLQRRLRLGGYSSSDADIYRFLRNSRDIRHGGDSQQYILDPFTSSGVNVAGSSLANFSSGTLTGYRLPPGQTSPSDTSYSEGEQPVAVQPKVTGKFLDFLTGTVHSAGATTEYSSIGSLQSTTNTSSSSLGGREGQSFKTIDVIPPRNKCPTFPLSPEVFKLPMNDKAGRRPFERIQLRHGIWLEKAWCFKHGRMEFSEALLIRNEVGVGADERPVQRRAGSILLVLGMMLYLPGGWLLIRSMKDGTALSTTAVAEVSRVISSGKEMEVVCCVHPDDAAMARAIENTMVTLAIFGALCWLTFATWAGINFGR